MVEGHARQQLIFLIERDDGLRSELQPFFEARGYRVEEMGTALEALHFLQEHDIFAPIILDSRLADISVEHLRRELHKKPNLTDLPIVLLQRGGGKPEPARRIEVIRDPITPELVYLAIKKLTGPSPVLLVVDDDTAVGNFLQIALEKNGFQVILAKSGGEAVALAREQIDRLACMLVDVQMPTLDGPQTFHALRQINATVPCCFMSGHTGKYAVADLLRLGAADVFFKPFASVNQLACRIWDIIER